jgi:hypothetical protein
MPESIRQSVAEESLEQIAQALLYQFIGRKEITPQENELRRKKAWLRLLRAYVPPDYQETAEDEYLGNLHPTGLILEIEHMTPDQTYKVMFPLFASIPSFEEAKKSERVTTHRNYVSNFTSNLLYPFAHELSTHDIWPESLIPFIFFVPQSFDTDPRGYAIGTVFLGKRVSHPKLNKIDQLFNELPSAEVAPNLDNNQPILLSTPIISDMIKGAPLKPIDLIPPTWTNDRQSRNVRYIRIRPSKGQNNCVVWESRPDDLDLNTGNVRTHLRILGTPILPNPHQPVIEYLARHYQQAGMEDSWDYGIEFKIIER